MAQKFGCQSVLFAAAVLLPLAFMSVEAQAAPSGAIANGTSMTRYSVSGAVTQVGHRHYRRHRHHRRYWRGAYYRPFPMVGFGHHHHFHHHHH